MVSQKKYIPWNKGMKGNYRLWENKVHPSKGKAPWNKGIPCSDETKIKIGESNKGRESPWKNKKRPENSGINHHQYGKPLLENVKKKISETKKRQFKEGTLKCGFKKGHKSYLTDESCKKISVKMLKWHHENKDTEKYKERYKNLGSLKKGKKRPDMIGNQLTKGIAPPSKKYLDEKLIINLYTNENKFPLEISKIFNCSSSVIYRILKENKIKIRGFKNHTRKTKIKISAIQQGIPVNEWKGFAKSEPYGEEFNLQLKNSIRKRDNQVCMNCGIHREKLREALHVHHINYDKKCNIEQNFISLCRCCHRFTNGNREYWTKLFQEKLSKLYNYKYSENKEIILNLSKQS